MTDDDFIEHFEKGTLDPADFSHEQHVRLGWLYIRRYPLTEAIRRFSEGLKRWTAALGQGGKYHETITWFYMLLIADRQSATRSALFEDFIERNGDLVASPSILWRYYSRALITSEEARTHYLLPDRIEAEAA